MTKQQYYAKCEELKPDLMRIVDERIKKAGESGAIDFDSYENNYLLSKIVFSAIGREIERQFKPFSKRDIKEVNNIYKFL